MVFRFSDWSVESAERIADRRQPIQVASEWDSIDP
jgi:hypothetical protein